MPDQKISAMTAATTLADTDELVLASSGANKKITGANLKASVCSGVLFTENFSSGLIKPQWTSSDKASWDTTSGHLKPGTGNGALQWEGSTLPFFHMTEVVFFTGATFPAGAVGIGLQHYDYTNYYLFIHVDTGTGELAIYDVINGALQWRAGTAGSLSTNTKYWLRGMIDIWTGNVMGLLFSADPALPTSTPRAVNYTNANFVSRFSPMRLLRKKSLRFYGQAAAAYIDSFTIYGG